MIKDCTALILAGGNSKRMGRDKAGLLLGEQTLLQHVSATMLQVFPHVMVSVRQQRPEINLTQVCDEQFNLGPLAGLVAGLARAETPWVFAVACDMPFVERSVIELLAQHRAGHQTVVPVVDGYPQPLSAFYAASCLAAMRASLAAQQLSLRGMLDKLDVRYLDEQEMRSADLNMRSFFDLDTPQDVAHAMQLLERK